MPDPQSYELTSLIKRLYTLQAQHIDLLLRPYGLARTQYRVLYHLRGGELPTAELQELLQVEGGTLSGLVDTLAMKGYVERREQPEDKRRKTISLTAAGRKLVDEIPPPAPQVQRVLAADLPPAAIEAFREICEQMVRNLRANTEKGGRTCSEN